MTYIKQVEFQRELSKRGNEFFCCITYASGRSYWFKNRLPMTAARWLCENWGYTPETEWERELVFRLTDGACHPHYSWESAALCEEEGVPF